MVNEDGEDSEEDEEEDYTVEHRGNISTVFSVISSVLSGEFLNIITKFKSHVETVVAQTLQLFA